MPDAGPNLDRLNLREYAGVRQMNASQCQAIIDADAFHGLADGVTHWEDLRRIDRAAAPMGYSRASSTAKRGHPRDARLPLAEPEAGNRPD